jgi:hypothetical protein
MGWGEELAMMGPPLESSQSWASETVMADRVWADCPHIGQPVVIHCLGGRTSSSQLSG